MLAGRDRETRAIEDLVAALRAARSGTVQPEGRPSALLLAGEHGVGKSALLGRAAELAGDLLLLRTHGEPADASPPLGGLADLLASLTPVVDELPPGVATTLARFLPGGEADTPSHAGDRFGTHDAVLALLRRASSERPVLLLVDDLPWLDADSRDALLHVVRRGAGTAVGLIATADAGDVSTLPLDLPTRTVEPLDEAASLQVLRGKARGLAPAAEQAVLAAAAGNPLALTELPTMLRPDQLAGLEDLPEHLPIGPRLRAGYAARLVALPPAAFDVLLALALAGDTGAASLPRILTHLGEDHSVLDPALDDGMIHLRHQRVVFAHPMVALAVLDAAGAGRIRRAHEHLAAVLTGPERAWHRASAVLGPDAEVSAELERAGREALLRSAPSAAADAFARAAALTEDAELTASRLMAAGAAAVEAGDLTRAVRLLDEGAATAVGATRWEVEHLAGAVEAWSSDIRTGFERLRHGAELAADEAPDTALLMLADAAMAASAWDCSLALDVARSAWAGARGRPLPVRAVVGLALCWALVMRGRRAEAQALATEVEPWLGHVDKSSPSALWVPNALNLRVLLEDYEGAIVLARVISSAVQEAGFATRRTLPGIIAADASRRLGRLEGQAETLEEILRAARDSGQRTTEVMGEVARAQLLATLGDARGCRDAAARAVRIGQDLGMETPRVQAGRALGLLALGGERWEEAARSLEEAGRVAEVIGYREPLFAPWRSDLVEAYVRLDRHHEAVRELGLLERNCAESDSVGAEAVLARCRALLSGQDDDYDEALTLHEQARMPFPTARTRLAWGEQLRRRRARGHARQQLRLAHDAFAMMGAEPWAARARRELAAADPVTGPTGITAQQRRIAEAVARGARNREVASELFVSEKTVERHLSRLFRIAGVRSRTELAQWLRRLDDGEAAVDEEPARSQ